MAFKLRMTVDMHDIHTIILNHNYARFDDLDFARKILLLWHSNLAER